MVGGGRWSSDGVLTVFFFFLLLVVVVMVVVLCGMQEPSSLSELEALAMVDEFIASESEREDYDVDGGAVSRIFFFFFLLLLLLLLLLFFFFFFFFF